MDGPNLFRSEQLSGWGRFPVERANLYRPERGAEVGRILTTAADPTYISRGLGRSYGDAALNREAGVISHVRLNRFLGFDANTGILECEAGLSFAEIIQVFLPRGYFLPVTPGTKYVTVGGAIASDVHGKNHHRDGTFGRFLVDFRLQIASGEVLVCSPEQNRDVFWATVGGMGLTGAILSARFRLVPVESAYVEADYQKAPDLDAALAAFAGSDEGYRYSMAWIDCLASGRSLGRSVLMRGNDAPRERVRAPDRDPLAPPAKRALSVPFDAPSALLNRFSIRAFNGLYYSSHRDATGRLVDFDSFFYPLDSVGHWNRLYGKRGFVQYQVAFPPQTAEGGLRALLERLSGTRRASFLAVLKRFGPANEGLLSFPFEGYTLALDLPGASGIEEFLRTLDDLVLRYGGRVYLAKDAVLSPESFAAMYPRAQEFVRIKRRLDPEGRISSSLARRIGLAG